MPEKTCLIIGRTEDFKNESVTRIAAEGGEPEYLDSCDLQEEYGMNVLETMTDDDLLSVFKDKGGDLYTGNAVDRKLEFIRKYVAEGNAANMSERFSGDPPGFMKGYISSIVPLHRDYGVPYFQMEMAVFDAILNGTLQHGDLQSYEEVFLWGCRDDGLPTEFWKSSMLSVSMYALLLKLSGKDTMRAVDLLNRCVAEAGPERKKVMDETGMTEKLAAFNAKMKNEATANPGANANQLKVGDKIDIPAIKKAIKGNRVTILFGWASWCPACMMAIPTLNGLVEDLGRRRVEVVGLIDASDTGKIAKTKKKKGVLWKKDIEISDADRKKFPRGVPFFVVVDGKGVVRQVISGVSRDLEENLKGAIPKKSRP